MRTAIVAALLAASAACAQSLKDFEKRVTEFDLSNGMHFIVVERHDAPVVSFHSYVNAGSVDDPKGQTGIAHMFEHMAFKGTENIGTKNYPAEKAALDEVERVYDQVDQLRRDAFDHHTAPDPKRLSELETQLKAAMDKANSYVIPNEYDRIVESSAVLAFMPTPPFDSTIRSYSFSSTKLSAVAMASLT